MVKTKDYQYGFTIVELLIATTVFSVVLIGLVSAVLYISETFISGSVRSQTQSTARSIEQKISQEIQLGSTVTPATSNGSFVCIGDNKYSYTLNKELDTGSSSSAAPLVVQNVSNCGTGTETITPGPSTELLGNHMRLGKFDVEFLGNGLYSIDIIIGYGDALSSLDASQNGSLGWTTKVVNGITSYYYYCHNSIVFGEFCAATDLSTAVQKRVNNGN